MFWFGLGFFVVVFGFWFSVAFVCLVWFWGFLGGVVLFCFRTAQAFQVDFPPLHSYLFTLLFLKVRYGYIRGLILFLRLQSRKGAGMTFVLWLL